MSIQSFTIRSALQIDARYIRSIVRQSRLYPFDLDWRRFMVAVAPAGEVIACGQVKTHADGSQEIASIAVLPEWRGRGVASAIIRRILEANSGVLYLMCRSRLGPFYSRFGFRAIEEAKMPPYFRRLSRLARWFNKLRMNGEGLLVMKIDAQG